jgi:2-polyprenyl-6-methoxyphenol hydroxylase-like FAD-dependent oxidoreductase
VFEKSNVDVLIVGAGPVGLFAALRLAKAGRTVRIIDRGIQTSMQSYALALHSSTLDLFKQDGISAELIKQGHPVRNVVFHESGQPEFGVDLTSIEGEFPFALVVPQDHLEVSLVEELRKQKVQVEWNRELTDFEVTPNGVQARVARLAEMPQGYAVSDFARVEQSHFNVTARHIIGADGYHSTVRHLLRIPLKHYARPRYFVVFEFETDRSIGDTLRVEITGGLTSILWPLPGRRCRWTFEVRETERRPGNPNVKELQEFISQRAPDFTFMPNSLRWGGRISFDSSHATQFGRGPLWLAGDAAHLTLPAGVQSMNAGLEEAALLSDALGKQSGTALEGALQEYADSRVREWEFLLGEHDKPSAPPFLANHWRDVRTSIPASGIQLRRLLQKISAT